MKTCHYLYLGSDSDWFKQTSHMAQLIRSATQIRDVISHQYGISVFHPHTAFCRETSGDTAKCQLSLCMRPPLQQNIPSEQTILCNNIVEKLFTCYTNKKWANWHLPADILATHCHSCTQVRYPSCTTHEGMDEDETARKKPLRFSLCKVNVRRQHCWACNSAWDCNSEAPRFKSCPDCSWICSW